MGQCSWWVMVRAGLVFRPLLSKPPVTLRPQLGKNVSPIIQGLRRGCPPKGIEPPLPGNWKPGPASRSSEMLK